MADGTMATQPTPAPQAQQQPQAGPAPEAQAAPGPDTSAAPEPGSREDFLAAMDGDAGSFLEQFIADAGLTLPNEQPPQAAPPQQQPQQQAPAPVVATPNGQPAPAPAPGNVAPTQPQASQVDPALVQRLFTPPQPAPAPLPHAMPAQPAWPAQPQMPQPQMQQPVAQQPQQQQPDVLPTPFDKPFVIPQEIAAAMEHDDPRVRMAAIGSIVSVVGNETFKHAVEYVKHQLAPQIAQATMGQFEQRTFAQTVQQELFGAYPQLRYAAPTLLAQAAQIVVQDEVARNPAAANAPPTREMWQKIGQLATAGLAQMGGGQMPQFAPPAMPQAPAPAAAPPGYVYSPAHGGWVPTGPAPMPVAPAAAPAAPFIAGQHGMPMGAPQGFAPTPESEFQSFMRGEWG